MSITVVFGGDWNMTFIFSIIYIYIYLCIQGIIIPIDEPIFFTVVGIPPTSVYLFAYLRDNNDFA